MGATGAKSSVFIGKEAAFGAEANVIYKIPFTSESLNNKIDSVESEALLGYRGTKTIAPGKEGAEGSVDCEAYPGTTGFLFYLALGKSSLDTDKTKISPIGINEELPSATIEVDHSGTKFKYTGMTVNSLKFSGAVGDIPKLTADFVGKEEIQSAATKGTLKDPGEEPYYFKDLILYTDEFTTTAELYSNIELNISNNLDTDDYRLDGTGKRKTLSAGKLEISGSIDMYFDASVISGEYAKFRNFSDGKLGIKLSKTSGETFTIFLPRIKFTEMTHDIGGSDKITIKANYKAVIPTLGEIIEAEDSTNTTGAY